MKLDKVTQAAVNALEDVKARDIQVLDVRKMTTLVDRMIIATGDSNRQCKALANRVREYVKAAGGQVLGVEGEQVGEWVLVDIGGALVHIMQPIVRQYYNLEELWTPVRKPRTRKLAAPQRSRA